MTRCFHPKPLIPIKDGSLEPKFLCLLCGSMWKLDDKGNLILISRSL